MTQIDLADRPIPRTGRALMAATIVTLPVGSIYAYSVFLAPLEQLLNANRSDLATVFGVAVIFFTLGMNFVPRLFGRMPIQWILGLATVLCAGGVALSSFARTYHELALGYGVLFAFGGGMTYVGIQHSINASPLSRPGLVNGYLVSLLPLGAMLAAPLFGWSNDLFGVRTTLLWLALSLAVSGFLAALLMARSGIHLAHPVMDEPESQPAPAGRRSIFWKIFFVFLFAATAGLTVLSQAAGMLTAYGNSMAVALAATTGITAAIAAARLAGGWFTDRFSIPAVAAGAHALALAGGLLLVIWPSPLMAIPTLGLIGAGYGLISGLTAGAIAFYWPKALFGRTASRIYIAWCLAALALPVVAARLYDLSGGYHTAIMLAAAANLLGMIVGASLPRSSSRKAAADGGRT